MTKNQADEIISLLKEQNKRLGALQRIESANDSKLDSMNPEFRTDDVTLDEWGHTY